MRLLRLFRLSRHPRHVQGTRDDKLVVNALWRVPIHRIVAKLIDETLKVQDQHTWVRLHSNGALSSHSRGADIAAWCIASRHRFWLQQSTQAFLELDGTILFCLG